MSRRIDIELTSALDGDTWTWRAAGARQPKGVVNSSVLPPGLSVGDIFKVDVEQEIDGITVLGVVQVREKAEPAVIELIPSEREFQPVVETRAKRDRNDRGGRDGRDGDRRPRRDRDDRGGRGDGRGRDGAGRGRPDGAARDGAGRGRPDGAGRGDGRGRPDGAGRGDGRGRGDGGARDGGRGRDGGGRRGPSFTPPPEIPQRPKPKRLRPGKAHRNTVLAELPEEQRAIAELALQGMGAVRTRVREENTRAVAEGRAEMPEASVMKIAEELLPKLRLAEWQDRAESALKQLEHLDLRDLRSVVVASSDPTVARDESSAALVDELKAALAHKQEQELLLWFGDVDAALAVGRVIRALRLSSQPPKAGVPFPVDIAHRLVDSVNASLAPMDSPERWSAMLEAAAFSPVRLLIKPARKPDMVNDELLATVKRLAPALPQIAAMFEVEVDPKASMPKPLRTNPRQRKAGEQGGKSGKDGASTAKQGGRRDQERRPKRTDEAARSQPEADTQQQAAAHTTPVAASDVTEQVADVVEQASEVAAAVEVAEVAAAVEAAAETTAPETTAPEPTVTEPVAEPVAEVVAEVVAETTAPEVADTQVAEVVEQIETAVKAAETTVTPDPVEATPVEHDGDAVPAES